MNQPSNDSGIPLLTEIIATAAPTQATPAPAKQSLAPSFVKSPASQPAAPAPMPSPPMAMTDEQWERLERETGERVLQHLLERIDFVLEQRVRDSLSDVLQTAVTALAVDIRSGLEHTLKDAVTRAVTQEISKMKSSKS